MGDEPRLVKGHDGEWVNYLHQCLSYRGIDAGRADGKFGDTIEAAVRQFQSTNNLSPDGVVGERTWDALVRGRVPAGSTSAAQDERLARFDINDYPLLALATRCGEGESGFRQFLLSYGMESEVVDRLFASR